MFICPSVDSVSTISTGEASDVISADSNYFLLYGTDATGQLNPITTPGPGPFFKFNMSYVTNASITNSFGNTQSFLTVRIAKLRPGSLVVPMVEKLNVPGEYRDPAVLFADGHVAYFNRRETQIQPDQLPYSAATSDANQCSRMIWSVAGPIH